MAIDTQLLIDSILHAVNVVGQKRSAREDAVRQAQLQGILKGPEYAHDLEMQRLRNQGQAAVADTRGESALDVARLRADMGKYVNQATNDTRRYIADQGNLARDRQILERGDQSYRLNEQKFGFQGSQNDLNRQNKLDVVGAQQQGATERTGMTTNTQREIAKGNQALGHEKILSSEKMGTKKIASTEKIAGQRSQDYRYGIDKREATALNIAKINNANHLDVAKIMKERGVEVARIAAKASTLNTLKRVQYQLQIAGAKGGKNGGIRSVQMKSWESELREIARQVSNPQNYFMPKDREIIQKLIQRRNAILEQVRRLEGDVPETDANAPALSSLQQQVFTPGPPNPPVQNAYRANPVNTQKGPIHWTLPFEGSPPAKANTANRTGARKQPNPPAKSSKKKKSVNTAKLMNTLNQL